MSESEELLCKRCKQSFQMPYGKSYKNCEPCRETLNLERRNKPKYNPNTQRICRCCKQVKEINSDFVMRIEKTSHTCGPCRELPKPPKEEKPLDVDRVLSNVARNLEKIIDNAEVIDVMGHIEQYIGEEEYEEEDPEDESDILDTARTLKC